MKEWKVVTRYNGKLCTTTRVMGWQGIRHQLRKASAISARYVYVDVGLYIGPSLTRFVIKNK